MSFPKIRDATDEMLALLAEIAENTRDTSHQDTEPGNGNGDEIHFYEAGDAAGADAYATTGPNGMSVTDEWDDVQLPFAAAAVQVRHDEDVLIAFARPDGEPHLQIPAFAHDGTATVIGGDGRLALNTDEVWVRLHDEADTDTDETNVHIVALG